MRSQLPTCALVAIAALSGAIAATAQTNQSAIPPSLSAPLMGGLFNVAKTRLAASIFGVVKIVDNRLAVIVTSNRAVIAKNNAAAVERGARYAPPDDLRRDVLMVVCGSGERIDQVFNCAQATVMNKDGRQVAPLDHVAHTETFRSALGATWTAQIVRNLYIAPDLADGFTVEFAETDGTIWTMQVSRTEADRDLFLRVDPDSGILTDCAAKANCN